MSLDVGERIEARKESAGTPHGWSGDASASRGGREKAGLEAERTPASLPDLPVASVEGQELRADDPCPCRTRRERSSVRQTELRFGLPGAEAEWALLAERLAQVF